MQGLVGKVEQPVVFHIHQTDATGFPWFVAPNRMPEGHCRKGLDGPVEGIGQVGCRLRIVQVQRDVAADRFDVGLRLRRDQDKSAHDACFPCRAARASDAGRTSPAIAAA